MVLQCPRCRSLHIKVKHYGRQTGSTIGTIAGATGGVMSVLGGARAGFAVGAFLGPIGSSLGGLSGAIVAGLICGTAGGSAGAAVGDFVDDNMLNKFDCLSCGHAFSSQTTSGESYSQTSSFPVPSFDEGQHHFEDDEL